MSTVSGYILRQTLAPLLVTVGIALLVLLTERMLRLLDLVLDSHGGLTVLLEMLAYLVPHYMALAMPTAFFLGVLLAFSKLNQRNELDALWSAGLGLTQLLRPVIFLALGLALISAFNFAVGQPYARYIYRSMVHEVAQTAVNVYLQQRTFMEVKGVTFMAETVERSSRSFTGVFIYKENKAGRSDTLTAESGSLEVAPQGEKSVLLLKDGTHLRVNPPGETKTEAPASHGVLNFDRYQLPIDLIGQDPFRPRGEDERELTLLELWQQRDTPPANVRTDEMLAEFHDRVVRTLSVMLLPFLAVPFAIGGRRSHQSYGIAAGLIILVAYNQVLNAGESLVSRGEISPFLGLWLPLIALTAGSAILFYRTAYQVSRGTSLPSPRRLLEDLFQTLRAGLGGAKRQHPE